METWCKNWRLKVNTEKTNIVHFRRKRKQRTTFKFKFENNPHNIVDGYKYLGVVLQENLDFKITEELLAGAAGRALGAIISKFKCLKNVSFKTFSKMYQVNVVPIVDYSSSVWGYANYDFCVKVQYRAIRYFLGVHPNAPLLGPEGDMVWENCKVRHFLAIIRLWNKQIKMNPDRLTKRIVICEYNLCKNWWKEVKHIFELIQCQEMFTNKLACNLTTVKK